MQQLIRVEELKSREVFPGHHARIIHGDHMTIVYWRIDAGATVPEHSHAHEQIVNVLSGRYELTVADKPLTLDAGMVAVVPSGVRHSGRAITNAQLLDAFHPVREDYRDT